MRDSEKAASWAASWDVALVVSWVDRSAGWMADCWVAKWVDQKADVSVVSWAEVKVARTASASAAVWVGPRDPKWVVAKVVEMETLSVAN